MMETTPLLVKKNDDNNTIKGKIFSRSAKYILLSCVFVLLATFAVTTTTSSSSPSSSSSERMTVRMRGYASRAAAPLFLRGRSTTTSSLDAAKLGEESATPSVITLSAACSPVDKLSFDPGNWENVGAKLISKTMSSDFAFENGIEMNAVKGKCGEYEVSAADLTVGEEFGFFLYSKTSGNGEPIKDIGCESSLDGSTYCPAHSAPEEPTIGGPFSMASCTKKITYGDLSFYNRVYDGSALSFTWGSCSNTCGLSEPEACSFSSTTEKEEVQVTFDLSFSGPGLSASDFGPAELESVASSTAEVVGVDASMVEVEVVESTANTGAELGSEEGVTTVNLQATINCIDSDVSASVTSKLNSLTEEDELKIATEAKIEGATSATGHLEETKILEWEKEETPSAPPAYDGPLLDCDATVDDEGYYLVFKHDSSKGNYWSKANNNAESKRVGSNPETDYKYSRLEEVEKFGRTDEGSFQFKLEYPTLSQTNIWTQTSNPVTAGKRGVDDFKAISIQANGHGTSTHSFKGLEYNSGSSNFIDGTVDHGNWFFSIGAYNAWGGTNKFPGPSSGYYLVFKHDSSKGNYWSKANNNAESKRVGSNPETDYKYSRLEEVEKFGRTDEGSFQFKLEYPTLSQTNIWTQTSNPVTAGKRGVDDFKAISIQANGHGTSTHSFKGLEYNSGSSNFIDGTVDHGNWFFSIGAYNAWGGTNKFPGPSSGVNMVKLWVKTSAKKPDSCPSPPPAPPPSPPPVLDCDATVDDEGYYLVFKHDSSKGNYWSKANNNAESKRVGSNPETDYKYSRLEEVEKFGRTDEGSFQFKLEYPTLSQTNIWTQTSNPVTAGKRGVDDFKAISIQANGHGTSTHSFKGLEYNSGSSNFIDGTVDHGNWFFSIGAYNAWGGTNKFPGPSSGVNMVKLWVKTSAKKPDSCALK
ncbi:unnamed protein product [Bathycoccus prasinos]